ncbi:MAG: sugar ABC transporter permease [Anaerolineae bacterium]
MRLTDRTYSLLLLTPAAIFILLFVVYPLFTLVYDSLHDVSLFAPGERTFVGFDNYEQAISSSRVRDAATRTLKYTTIALSAEFFLGFVVALVFKTLGEKFALARTAFLFPLMIPPIVAGLLWRYMLMSEFGVVNWILDWLGVVQSPNDISWLGDTSIVLFSVAISDIWLTTSFVAMVTFTGLQNIPQEIIEAAKIDGAGAIQTFRRITLPLLRPVIAVVLIIRGIDAARTFDMIWIQTEGGPRFASEVLSLQVYRTMIRYGRLGEASALATLFMIGLLGLSLIAFYSIWRPGLSDT